jgi:hypothetical protein
MPNKLDQRFSWKYLPIVAINDTSTLQGDTLQIGILLKKHPVLLMAVRGIVEPSPTSSSYS